MADHRVAILGAGFGGLGMGARLKETGEDDFIILEKSAGVGGTWRDNTYPGAGCDVPSHLYSFSFEPNPDWSRKFSGQAEIAAYAQGLAERRGLMEHIRFGAEVTGASWDPELCEWRIELAGGETLTAGIFVAAWGQLNRPAYPDVPGRESFSGPAFHSARWDHGAMLEAKRIAVIGSGASAVQFIPQIAPLAAHLTVFQRTPNWVLPRGDRAYGRWERWLLRRMPFALRASRAIKYWLKDMTFAAFRPGTSLSRAFRQTALKHLERQVADPALRAVLTPDYTIGCKRILISDDLYPALSRPNVEVVGEAVARIEADAVIDAAGVRRPVDVVIYATGFETTSLLGTGEITGEDGLTLSQAWADGAKAYLGVAVAGFPNFFLIYGPNTNLGHNSIIFMMERQIDYVLKALAVLRETGASHMSVKPEAQDQFNSGLQADLSQTAFAAECASWYKTADGLITNNWSGTTEAYARATRRVRIADYDIAGFGGR